jgi:hypothetical protein
MSFVNAEKFSKGKVIYNDGKSKTGFIESSWNKTIQFKTSETATAEKINVDDLKTVVYFNDDGTTDELDRVKRYGLFNKLTDYEWLHVAERGAVTIYVIGTTMGKISGPKASFTDYYAIREGELGAKMICSVSSGNPNSVFRNRAPVYFADYPELAEKIKSKLYTYKTIMLAVREYNNWAAQKINKR